MEFHSLVANFQVMHVNGQLMRYPGGELEAQIRVYKASCWGGMVTGP